MEAVGILNCKVGELSKENARTLKTNEMLISRIAKLEANVEVINEMAMNLFYPESN